MGKLGRHGAFGMLMGVLSCDASGSSGDGSADAAGGGDGGSSGAGGSQEGGAGGASAGAGGASAGAGGQDPVGTVDGGGGDSGPGAGGDSGAPSPPGSCAAEAPATAPFYVATDGSDDTGDGSENEPWATIPHALESVPDGSTILVKAGEYAGRVQLDEVFDEGVVVRSEVPYAARLRHTSTVVTSYYGEGITLEGFDVAHSGPGAGALVIQIQNLRSDGGVTSRITLRNNVLHDSYDNDILKINNGAEDVRVERNLFYNQAGSDEHIDINSVTDVVVQDNVFFNDFAGSGRTNGNDTSSYVVIKDSNGNDDGVLGSSRIVVRRNVFLNWEGGTGANFLLVGEDGTPNFEATDVLVENNLFLGNSTNVMRAAFGVKGSSGVTFRANTVVGDLPSLAFAVRLNVEGDNMPNDGVELVNNIWADPTGTMEDFSDTPPAETASFTLDHNLYFNGGAAVPEDGAELVNPSDDDNAVLGDPGLGSLAGLILPRWDPGSSTFADGSSTICEVHERLVDDHAVPGTGSAALAAADPAASPADNILGEPRSGAPNVGAY